MRKEIVMVGFGGQGVQSLGRALTRALYEKGFLTSFKSNYGPEARGGNSSSQVVIRESPSDWPDILGVDILVAMSQEGYDSWTPRLATESIIIYDNGLVRPASLPKARQYPVPASEIASGLGARIAANMVMLGAVASLSGLVKLDEVLQVVSDKKKGEPSTNAVAVRKGYELASSQR